MLKEILTEILSKKKCSVEFSLSEERLTRLINEKFFVTLVKIIEILEDNSLNDFMCIDAIMTIFEDMGINLGNRHDLG